MVELPLHSVRQGEIGGHETVILRSAAADLEATFAPRLGLIGCSLVHAAEELLALPGGLATYARAGSAMGIPFLYPWANRLAGFSYSAAGEAVTLDPDSPLLHLEDNGLPIHGLLAASPHWQLREAGASEDAASLLAELDFGAHDDLLTCFPFPHIVRLEARLQGNALTIRTTVTPTGDSGVPICFGFHPYLQLPGVPRERWKIDLPVERRLLLDARMIPTGATEPVSYEFEPLGDRSFDDGYEGLIAGRPFVLEAAGRRLEVSFIEGYPYAQVFSPPGAQFICFEPMTAPANALVRGGEELPIVKPSESFTAAFSISAN